MKKVIAIVCILMVVAAGIYLYIRFVYLKVADFKPDTSKERSILDLRPAIIAKLRQLVQDGSNGLYVLSVGKLEPDVMASTLDIMDAGISIDSIVLKKLGLSKKLPDDVFKISFHLLHIDGVGIADLLQKNKIDVEGIYISDPLIEVYHEKRAYNKPEREKNDSLSFYQRIMKQMNSIAIGKINIQHGRLVIHDMAKKKIADQFNDFSLGMNNILLDSSTQYDHNRFFFAKHAAISFKNYILPTSDSLYYFSVDSLLINGEQDSLTAFNVQLKPRYSKEQFEKRIDTRKEMFRLKASMILFSGVNWWAMMNKEKFIAKDANVFDGSMDCYFDLSKPRRSGITVANFPDQMLMQVSIPLSIANTSLHHVNISYEEYHPDIDKSGTITFEDINAQVTGITNIPAQIRIHPVSVITGTCLLMEKVQMSSTIRFDLSQYRTGEFNIDVQLKAMDKELINPVAETLGGVHINSGILESIDGHMEGNNFQTNGRIKAAYRDLDIAVLKKEKDNEGNIKKKTLLSFFANTFLIKKSNPSPGKEIRSPGFLIERGHHSSFFNFVWQGFLAGLLKTIGVPVKLVIK